MHYTQNMERKKSVFSLHFLPLNFERQTPFSLVKLLGNACKMIKYGGKRKAEKMRCANCRRSAPAAEMQGVAMNDWTNIGVRLGVTDGHSKATTPRV